MITPLSVAINWPTRLNLNLKKLSLHKIGKVFLNLILKISALKLGWEVLENPYYSPIVLNASNEIAVDAFLKNQVKFVDIYSIVYETLNFSNSSIPKSVEEIIEIDKLARMNSLDLIKRKFNK